ncbi:MAG: hypothetical protein R3F55_01910 [Alphaproteobacteria bacterium]
MSEIDRDAFLASLERLLSDSDQEVLAAAREIRTQMTEAEVNWDMLLVQAPGEDDDGYDHHDEPADDAAGFDQAPASTSGDLALIDELLGKHSVSDETRAELESYREDIAEGEFSQSDSRYLQALYQRVTGKKR